MKILDNKSTKNRLFMFLLFFLAVVSIIFLIIWLIFFRIDTNNCQENDQQVKICNVFLTIGSNDSILSTDGEAKKLEQSKWGTYWGSNFRAPLTKYQDASPVLRIYNKDKSLHDWVIVDSESDYATSSEIKTEGTAFYAWTSQIVDTVPVYRISRGGDISQNTFSTDKNWIDNILEQNKNIPNGWKKDINGSFIAFYAYPPKYKVNGKKNAYDCSELVNFLSKRCKTEAKNLEKNTK